MVASADKKGLTQTFTQSWNTFNQNLFNAQKFLANFILKKIIVHIPFLCFS